MRVTENQRYVRHLRRITQAKSRLAGLQDQVTTGVAVSRPSDDPTTHARLTRLRRRLDTVATFDKNATSAARHFQAAESALDQMSNTLVRGRELVVRGLNGSLTAENRGLIATEFAVLRDQFKQLADTRSDGAYVFSGTASDRPPLDDTGAYVGGGAGRITEIADNLTVDLALGTGLFSGDVNIAQVLDDAIAALENNDITALETSLGDIDTAQIQVVDVRTDTGARLDRVRTTSEVRDNLELEMLQEHSELGDADIAAVIAELTGQEQSLQAAVQMAGRALTPSLLDIL